MVTVPPAAARISLPVDAPMSIPLWFDEAPSVGELLPPNPDVIRLLEGQGHIKLISPRLVVLYVVPAASACFLASSSCLLISSSISFILASWSAISFRIR